MTCDHPGCRCAVSASEGEGRRYCSEDCALEGGKRSPEGCRCGHRGCEGRPALQ